MKTEAITLFKEDVLALGRLVDSTVEEMACLLKSKSNASLDLVEQQEEKIDQAYLGIEETCMDLLLEKDSFTAKEIRTVVGSTIIASKFERMADHANRVARTACWANQDKIEIPSELLEMANIIHRMVQDVLFAFLTDSVEHLSEILQRDAEVDYFDDVLSKKLLSDLGQQGQARAQMQAQFLFSSRFLERMGDLCTSVAKRTYFIVTGLRLKSGSATVI